MLAGHHILELINDLLDLATIEVGKFDIKLAPIELERFLHESIQLIEPLAKTRGIELIKSKPENKDFKIMADSLRLKQVIINLLSNAVKYNQDHGSVTISYKKLDNGLVKISVKDTGIGLPNNNLEGVFTPFERLGAENTEIEGTGVGLSISKQLIELMGGQIGVETQQGRGSTFWVSLPVAEDQPPEPGELNIDNDI